MPKITFFCLTVVYLLLASGCASKPVSVPPPAPGQQAKEQLSVPTDDGEQQIAPTVVSYEGEALADPLEFINRPIFAFNDVLYRYALSPVGHVYVNYTPTPVQSGVSNFFANIREPLNFVNHGLQLNVKGAGTNVARFVINSTIGLFGLFDPAEHWFGIIERKQTLGDTLGSYGLGHGAYLVLPLLGQSDLRSGTSSVVETLFSPVRYISDEPQTTYLQITDGFQQAAGALNSYPKLRKEAEDPYLFFRNLYLQSLYRDQQFEPQAQPAPTVTEQ